MRARALLDSRSGSALREQALEPTLGRRRVTRHSDFLALRYLQAREMNSALEHLLLERLGRSDDLDDDAVALVLASCDGKSELEAALRGETAPKTVAASQLALEPDAEPAGAYLGWIEVQGFRGVGPRVRLEVAPGPGLTLVLGRNGSGKSSFAEGLELLLTGANSRWVDRTKVWTAGWQNLHADGPTTLEAGLFVEGERGATRVRRSWARGAPIDPGEAEALRAGGGKTPMSELGWAGPLERYRPFLSYNELGSMFDELKSMYDALAAILGLEELEVVQQVVRDARLTHERALRTARQETRSLVERLGSVQDERVGAVLRALGGRNPDLDMVELALEGAWEGVDPASELALLRALTAIPLPDPPEVEASLARLAEARAAEAELVGSDAERAAVTAELLRSALRLHEHHDSATCPVCATPGVLDDEWRARARGQVDALQASAAETHRVTVEVREAAKAVSGLLEPGPPSSLLQAAQVGVHMEQAVDAWAAWGQARGRVASDEEARDELHAALDAVRVQVEAGKARAAAELERREDAWRPFARELSAWLPGARAALASREKLGALRAAEEWIKEAREELQAARLAPIADRAKDNWDQLRQESNVSLQSLSLRRSGNTRAAEVDVRVDGADASAFGVMSQGELHALAVSVFLPRAALPESPFRFMVIDDPVQSMDPAKVDGLARVLHATARERQVIVLTHDDRLSDAVRRLGLSAEVLEVTRRPGSVVEVRRALDPVERYIADARALLADDALPERVTARVVPGFCRQALEAASARAVRRRRLARGERHAEVEAILQDATTLYPLLALALFDDAGRGGDVLAKLNGRWGRAAGDAVTRANRGAHEPVGRGLRDLVSAAARLAREIADLK